MNTVLQHQPPELLERLLSGIRGQDIGLLAEVSREPDDVSNGLRNIVLLNEVNVDKLKLSLNMIFVS